jgi:hypothetical protein
MAVGDDVLHGCGGATARMLAQPVSLARAGVGAPVWAVVPCAAAADHDRDMETATPTPFSVRINMNFPL